MNTKPFLFLLSGLLLVSILTACNDDADRFERIDRLRVLGIVRTPSIASFSDTTISSTWLVATPNQTDAVTATNVLDTEALISLPLNSTNITSTKTTYGNIDIHEVTADTTFAPAFPLPVGPSGEQRFRISIKASQGTESVQAVSDILRFPNNFESLNLVGQEPSITVSNETKTQAYDADSEEIDLKCDIVTPSDEDFKISWYTTAGKIENTKACETIMKPDFAKSGETHAIIVCVRGNKTRSTSCDYVDVQF